MGSKVAVHGQLDQTYRDYREGKNQQEGRNQGHPNEHGHAHHGHAGRPQVDYCNYEVQCASH